MLDVKLGLTSYTTQSKAIPWHGFILWSASLERLLTKDVLYKHDMSIDLSCVLCGQEEESHNRTSSSPVHFIFSSRLHWVLNATFQLL